MNSTVVAAALRRIGILRAAYRLAFAISYLRNYVSNRRFKRENPGFVVPPARLLFVTQPTTSFEVYYSGGLTRARWMYQMACDHIEPKPVRVCEWGCGTGRVIRHLPLLDPEIEAYGTDYNTALVRWCQANINGVKFIVNGIEPPLPFVGDHFDFMYSLSVYTHLPEELQVRWLEEQLRVVRPGGIIFLSVHGDAFKHRLLRSEREQYESGEIVVHGRLGPGEPWFTAFNSPHYMEQSLLKGLDVVYKHTVGEEQKGSGQDFWAVRKPG